MSQCELCATSGPYVFVAETLATKPERHEVSRRRINLRQYQQMSGFTLTELMVGMIVSGIVVSALWYAWHIVSMQARQMEERKVGTTEISLFHQRLYSDFQKADTILFENNVLSFRNATSKNLDYNFSDGHVLRYANDRVDTFGVQVSGAELNPDNGFHCKLHCDEYLEEIYFLRQLSAKERIVEND